MTDLKHTVNRRQFVQLAACGALPAAVSLNAERFVLVAALASPPVEGSAERPVGPWDTHQPPGTVRNANRSTGLTVQNGWYVHNGRLVWGYAQHNGWWRAGQRPNLDLSQVAGTFEGRWFDPRSGQLTNPEAVTPGASAALTPPGEDCALWLRRVTQ